MNETPLADLINDLYREAKNGHRPTLRSPPENWVDPWLDTHRANSGQPTKIDKRSHRTLNSREERP